MSSAYEVAPVFLIRLAGVPFDLVEQLATPESLELARENSVDVDLALKRELDAARKKLLETSARLLPRVMMFSSGGVRDLLAHLLSASTGPLPPRNAKLGERERHLLLYLQRVCTKNDTFSEFGPSGWGKIDNRISGVSLNPQPGIAKRDTYFERWVAHAIAAAANLQVPALEPHTFEILLHDLEHSPEWMSILQPLAELPAKFAAALDTQDRQSILDDASEKLRSLGAEKLSGDRSLYAATNPIGEECFRECNFEISAPLLDEVATQAEPWIDLWRDTYAFVASRVAETLRHIMEKAGAKSGTMRLPDFMRACEAAKLSLTGPGLVAPAVMAFQEVKAAFRQRLQPHVDLTEYSLTTDDCHVVRNNFTYPKFDEYTYPSADLQLAAANPDAVARGNYRWILAELHPPVALLHHCMYWACPDKPTLNDALASTAFGKPNFHFGFFAADFTAHTSVRVFDAMPQLTHFVAAQRANPNWLRIPTNDCEVYIDSASGDVCLRKIDNQQHLGSFARAWVIPLGFHPFQFAIAPHTPRLLCGNVVVQRRTWTVTLEEFPRGNFNGTSRDLLTAIETLRAQRDLPRHIYIRPTELALRRSGAEGRDKDTKPIYVDLESYLFLEIFYRWLKKAGELEITEMLPAPNELLWQEPDGRRTFELRTQIVPRKR
ncbi:MAG: hypothetical protein QOG48_2076 [Verrucomicrobiota bacterium]